MTVGLSCAVMSGALGTCRGGEGQVALRAVLEVLSLWRAVGHEALPDLDLSARYRFLRSRTAVTMAKDGDRLDDF